MINFDHLSDGTASHLQRETRTFCVLLLCTPRPFSIEDIEQMFIDLFVESRSLSFGIFNLFYGLLIGCRL